MLFLPHSSSRRPGTSIGPSSVIGSPTTPATGAGQGKGMVVKHKPRDSSSSSPGPSSPNKAKSPSASSRRPAPSRLPSIQAAVSIAVVALALLAHLFAPHLPQAILHFFTRDQQWSLSSPGITFRNPVIFGHQPAGSLEPTSPARFSATFNTRPERSMALVEHAKSVAAQFDFTPDAVNKAVKEFRKEMGRFGSWVSINGR